MEINFSELSTRFWHSGFCLIDDLFPADLLKEWKHNVEYLSEHSEAAGVNRIDKVFEKEDLETRDSSGSYKFTSIDGRANSEFRCLQSYYFSISNFLSLLLNSDIVTSFDEQSSISFMKYDPPGGTLLNHFDSNFPSFVLYLTDNPDEGATEILPITALRPTILNRADEVIGPAVKIYPKFGQVLLFNGARCWHGSNPVFKFPKISAVFNYYVKGNEFRPDQVSKRLYN